MAKIVITVVGTHGEVRPMLALGLALRDEGHEIVMCAPPNEEKFVRKFGFPFFSAGCDIQAMLGENKQIAGNPIKMITSTVPMLREMLSNQIENLLEASHGADYLIGSGEQFATPSVAGYLKIPHCYIGIIAQFIPSKYHPPTIFPQQKLPRWGNQAFWGINKYFTNMILLKQLNETRRKFNLAPVQDIWDYMSNPHKFILAVDKELTVIPPDVKLNCTQTAYCHLAEKSGLPPEVQAFIAAGETPIYLGFGSMHLDPGEVTRIITEVVAKTGIRVLFSKGWESKPRPVESPNIFLLGHVPHDELFPHMAAVVHAGGTGTVSTTAHAGVPQVIVPHVLDQFYWADKIHQLGFSPKPILGRLTVENLGQAIREATANPAIQANCRKLGEQLRSINGVNETVKVIKETFNL